MDTHHMRKGFPDSHHDIDAATVEALDADTLTDWLRLAWERGYGTARVDRTGGMPGTVWHSVNPYARPEPEPARRRWWGRWLR